MLHAACKRRHAMRVPHPIRRELSALLRLTALLLATGLGQMMLGIEDTAIVGRLGEVPLGAVGLGNNLYFTVAVLGVGWMLALHPVVAQAVGTDEPERARAAFWQGLWVAALGAAPLTHAPRGDRRAAEPGCPRRDGGRRRPVPRGAGGGAAAVPGARRVALLPPGPRGDPPPPRRGRARQPRERPPELRARVRGPGARRRGAVGAGVASNFATVPQAALLGISIRRLWGPHRGRRPLDWPVVRRLLALGLPIGAQLVAEFGSFAVVGVLMSNLGTRALGSHQVALTLISFTFQLALALGSATSVRVGHGIGRGDAPATRRSGLTGIATGGTLMLGFSAAFLTVPGPLARILTDDLDVVRAAGPLLTVAAAFQLFDGVQAVAAGGLRGAGDTRWPLASKVVGHYLVGVPLAAALAFGLGWGAVGLWWGLSAGLTAVAVALTARFAVVSRRPIDRA